MGQQVLSHLIYVSVATEAMTSRALDDLLAESRRYNERERLTGMLLYKNQRFMQVLEGEDAAIAELFETVKHDPRHEQIDILRYEHIQYRSFPDWSMAFQNVDELEVSRYEGIDQLDDLQLEAPYFNPRSIKAHELLLAFKSALWERL